MKVPTPQYRCPLGRLQPQATDLDVIKESGWRDQHILVAFCFAGCPRWGVGLAAPCTVVSRRGCSCRPPHPF